LLSKSVTATLPAALLVILWWRRGRLSGRDDVAPLLPWFALGAAAGLFTAWVERRYIGAEGAAFSLTLLERGLLAGRVAWFYLGKLVWPANLMFTYPHWTVAAGAGWFLFPIGAAAVLAGLWLWRGRSRGPLAGALFFVGSLFPALGFVNVYPFRFSYVADHFQYLASLGILALAAAGWAGGLRQSRIVAVLLLGVLGVLTWKQSRLYRDPQVLYRETLRRNPEAWIVDASLGATLVGEGRPAEALPFYEEALRLAPDYAQGYYDLGNALAKVGRGPAAIDAYRQALRLKPFYVDAHNNLGVALAESGQVSAAVAEYEQALRLQPDQVPARNNLANALVRLHRPAEAIAQYEEALRLSPGLAEAHYGLGLALATSGRLAEAIGHYREALRLNPNYAEAHANLAGALANSGQLAEAVAQFEEALRLQPGSAAVRYNLALALRAEGRMEDARAQFEEARRLEANP
jgi:tetratricopeptide (TPR) repeat protein